MTSSDQMQLGALAQSNGVERVGDGTLDHSLYDGLAGIGLFFDALSSSTDESGDFSDASSALLQAAARRAASLPPFRCGLFDGRIGVGLAISRSSVLSYKQRRDLAERVVQPTFGTESLDSDLDVVSGSAGAVIGLLELAESLEWRAAKASAYARAHHLLHTASRRPEGWSWRTCQGLTCDSLVGYGHGAGGIGVALLAAWRAFGESQFLDGAQAAFAYERCVAASHMGLWADFRVPEIALALRERRALPDSVLAGIEAGTYRRPEMSAWCHGATGVALARLYATRLVKCAGIEADLVSALSSMDGWPGVQSQDWSLCHGLMGHCEVWLECASNASLVPIGVRAAAAVRRLEECVQRAEEALTLSRLPFSPMGLMVGTAGVGYQLLRLARPSLSSVLAPVLRGGRSRTRKRVAMFSTSSAAAMPRLRDAQHVVCDAISRSSIAPVALHLQTGDPLNARSVAASLVRAVRRVPDARLREELVAHLAVLRLELRGWRRLEPPILELVDRVVQPTFDEVLESCLPVSLSRHVAFEVNRPSRAVKYEGRSEGAPLSRVDAAGGAILVMSLGGRVLSQPVGVLGCAVLLALASAKELPPHELLKRVTRQLGYAQSADEQLTRLACEQVRAFYTARVVEPALARGFRRCPMLSVV